jgi:hypothetical protein
MSQFAEFEQTYGPPEHCEKPGDHEIRAYEHHLPPELLAHWREVGRCAYGKGVLWVNDPKQFDGVLEDWGDFGTERPLLFLRTAFAHLYFWHNGYVQSLEVHGGSLSQVTPKIARMFKLLTDPQIQEKILRVRLFEEARQRLGPPDRDECYAFEPALALGGPGTVETIRRVKMREHLGILAQLVR